MKYYTGYPDCIMYQKLFYKIIIVDTSNIYKIITILTKKYDDNKI